MTKTEILNQINKLRDELSRLEDELACLEAEELKCSFCGSSTTQPDIYLALGVGVAICQYCAMDAVEHINELRYEHIARKENSNG